MTRATESACHCGAVRVRYETELALARWPLRACQCSFCRRHGAVTTSDPNGRIVITATGSSMTRYRFGRRIADAILCAHCGVYVATTVEIDGCVVGVVNLAGIGSTPAGRAPEPKMYDAQSDEARQSRRQAEWSPVTFVDAVIEKPD